MRSSANVKHSSRPKWAGPLIAVGIGAMAALAIAYGLRLLVSQPRVASNAEPEPSAVASIVGRERPTTIIVSTPNSNDCRRYQLNVDTGARNDQGPVNCNADSSKQPGRLEAISKAFRNH
jgi:negative regulator of sigma E activity